MAFFRLHSLVFFFHKLCLVHDGFLKGRARGLTSHNAANVYSRQLSFLPTIMRGIESQEMFVFLSIRAHNATVPKGLQKHLSSKDSSEN